ncbi:MAG: FAD-dependent oxidoreductase [Oscillospiraceae bacterium]|nr:FAD-dependent oxidoreductase [Oscillospiraceae bacterium]
MYSVWTDKSALPHFKSLNQDKKTDVLIIGGGMAGLLCAYMLNQRGIDYILAEAKSICGGITKNTTAKITSQHGFIYDKLINCFGMEKAGMYLRANQNALEQYRLLCGGIDCDFENKDAYVYSLRNAPGGKNKAEKEAAALQKLGFEAEFADKLPLPFDIAGAVRFKNQAQFNPLKFASGISKDLNIFENTEVKELSKHTAITDGGKITAEKIIVATHFPFINKHGSYFLKMYQHRSYVIALENAQNVDGMYVDQAQCGMSFRNYEDMLLIGGGDHRTGKNGGNWNELRGFASRHYPEATEKYSWATQDCMTLDGVPYIGQYSKSTPDFFVATGFNKWGMTSSMAAAVILADLVSDKPNEFTPVFSPSRSMLKPQLFINAFEAVINLLSISKKRCPHLGCALKWNEVERSWDCPCHGSRFDQDGELIDNPATGDLKGKE